MNLLTELLQIPPFSWTGSEKKEKFRACMMELTDHHRKHCVPYACFVEGWGIQNEIPFLPVRMFKELRLSSVPDNEIVKTLMSSGTTGQKVSQIYLDRAAVSNQQRALAKIVSDFTGSQRMPMIIIDHPNVIKDRAMFSARGAGIMGFSIFGSQRIYAFDSEMNLDLGAIKRFLEVHSGKKIFLFGFTYMIWEYFYKKLLDAGEKLDLSNAILIHGGGWKKMAAESVTSIQFKEGLGERCGLSDIHDYYGMVEQTGCIFMECSFGHLHVSNFSDLIVRRAQDFSECSLGEEGILQVLSVLPRSYPGHSILTEDKGILLGEDDCLCQRKGKYFKVTGRLKNAEIRGCSDTYEKE